MWAAPQVNVLASAVIVDGGLDEYLNPGAQAESVLFEAGAEPRTTRSHP
jgi:hypothetical protein